MRGSPEHELGLPREVKPADFSLWARSPCWTLEEAVALALGASPDDVESYLREPSLYGDGRGHQVDKGFAGRHRDLKRLLERRFGGDRDARMAPADLVAWLQDTRLDLPAGLAEAVEEYGQDRTCPTGGRR